MLSTLYSPLNPYTGLWFSPSHTRGNRGPGRSAHALKITHLLRADRPARPRSSSRPRPAAKPREDPSLPASSSSSWDVSLCTGFPLSYSTVTEDHGHHGLHSARAMTSTLMRQCLRTVSSSSKHCCHLASRQQSLLMAPPPPWTLCFQLLEPHPPDLWASVLSPLFCSTCTRSHPALSSLSIGDSLGRRTQATGQFATCLRVPDA